MDFPGAECFGIFDKPIFFGGGHLFQRARFFQFFENSEKFDFKNFMLKNSIFSSGDIPNLFPSDEKAEILEKVSTQARSD